MWWLARWWGIVFLIFTGVTVNPHVISVKCCLLLDWIWMNRRPKGRVRLMLNNWPLMKSFFRLHSDSDINILKHQLLLHLRPNTHLSVNHVTSSPRARPPISFISALFHTSSTWTGGVRLMWGVSNADWTAVSAWCSGRPPDVCVCCSTSPYTHTPLDFPKLLLAGILWAFKTRQHSHLIPLWKCWACLHRSHTVSS